MKFEELDINQNIQKGVAELGFINLTEIQLEAIPYLLESNNDLIGLAQTGTGKTAAFSLPIIEKIDTSNKKTQCIILCPTRELCIQITKDIQAYAKYERDLRITPVYGGSNIQTQIKSLNSGSQIVVGTPGRVIDLIKRGKLKLKNIEYLVLDEADEMLNMGFKDDIDFILAETPLEKQSLLFSATMPKEVLRISKNYMQKPKHIEVENRNEGVKNIEHHYYIVSAKDKYKALRRICDMKSDIYAIVFCRTRRETKDIAEKLMKDGYYADALHGDLSQSQRDNVMNRFRKKNIQILIATDVAARGIDINDITHVINYNIPDDNEIYIHRSGRTGRAGKKGISIIISHSRQKRKLQSIEKLLKKKLTLKQVPSGKDICEQQLLDLVEKVVNTKINNQIEDFLPSIQEKLSHLDRDDLLKQFISVEFNRFLSFYKNAQDINISNEKKQKIKKKARKYDDKSEIGRAEKGYTRFFINLGRKQDLKPQDLIGLINDTTQKRNIPIGKIDIMRKFSFFEVDSDFENIILNSFKSTYYNGFGVIVETSKKPNEKDNKLKSRSVKETSKARKKKRKTSSYNRKR